MLVDKSHFGASIRAFAGYRSGWALVLNSALAKDAREIGARIATLNHLWLGEQAQAIAKLEAGLDDILVGFDPEEPYTGPDGQPLPRSPRRSTRQDVSRRASLAVNGEVR